MSELLEGPAPQESSASAGPKCSSTAQVPHVLPVMLGGVAKWLLARGEGTQLPRGVDEVRPRCECTEPNPHPHPHPNPHPNPNPNPHLHPNPNPHPNPHPHPNQVRLSCACTQENRTLVARREVSHVMGELDEPALGLPLHLLPGLDTALRSMRTGERAFFSLAAAAAAAGGAEGSFGGPPPHAAAQEAVHCDVELLSLTQIEDVSPHADRALLKTTLMAGRGGETPADGAHVVVPGPPLNPPSSPTRSHVDPHLRPQPALIPTLTSTPAAPPLPSARRASPGACLRLLDRG
jgi:hypothetical protein